MFDLAKFIRPAAADAGSIRQKIAEIDAGMSGLEIAVRSAERARADALLTKTDREIEALEKEMALAIRNRDRAIAARALLEQQAADAEEATSRAELDAARSAAEKRASVVAGRIRSEYEAASLKVASLLADLHAAEIEVADVNRRLAEAGRSDEALASVETRAVDHGRNHEIMGSLLNTTSLRPIGRAPGWGNGARLAADLGLPR